MRRAEIAATVRARRKASGQTQQRLSERLGVSVMRVSEWERALSRPSPALRTLSLCSSHRARTPTSAICAWRRNSSSVFPFASSMAASEVR